MAKHLDLAGLTAYDEKLKGWFKSGIVDITDNSIKELFGISIDGPWVTFTAEEDNSSIGLVKLSTNQTLEYSTDVSNWSNFDKTTNIPLNNGDKVYVRGMLSADNTSPNYTQFKMSGKIAASGNCNAIWDYQDLNAPLKKYCGYKMFNNCSSLTTAPKLPATVLANHCYKGMFQSCTSLTTAPEILPATTLASCCYQYMFDRCTALTTAPELPATSLANYCYSDMFNGCSKLNRIKCLATYILAIGCTENWVSGVSMNGTFVKHPKMITSWNIGTSGIPEGWTVIDAEL